MKPFFKNGETVLFQGDSVTDSDRRRCVCDISRKSLGEGYPQKFSELYNLLFPGNSVNFVNRGIGGDRIESLLNRYEEDFKKVNPDFISILIGVNDTWRAFDAKDYEPAEVFEERYERLLNQIKADFPDAKILLISQFVLPNFSPNGNSYEDVLKDFEPKLAVTEKLSKKYADYYLPMHEIINENAKQFDDGALSRDGVHPSAMGHSLIATEIAKALEII